MFRRLARKLLLVLALWVVTPTLFVMGHAALLPERVGTFENHVMPHSEARSRAPTEYVTPPDIGTRHVIQFGAAMGLGGPEERIWHGLGPRQATAPRPTLVLLHGAERNGQSMLDMWQDVAVRNDVILLAPDARGTHWSLITDGPFFLNEVLQDAARHYPVDPDRIFLAGHSDGGAFALRLANLGGGPFKAVVAHAGHPKRFRVIPALTPIPVHGFVGDADTVFPADGFRGTLEQLAKAGHPASLTVIPGHAHWYYDIGRSLAPIMWARVTENIAIPSIPLAQSESPSILRRGASSERAGASGSKWIRVSPTD